MQLAFCLYKYFPYGGLQRTFLRIALACQARGHAVRVYTLDWSGEVPEGFEIVLVPVTALTNIRRYQKFAAWVTDDLRARPVDRVVGFNKMPGLDVYYAGDPCYEDKARTLRNPFYRLSARYRHFAAAERAVFAPPSQTRLLMISRVQQTLFEKYYGTPPERFHMLPPGIARDRRAPSDAPRIRAEFRTEFGLADDDLLLLQIGSDFKRKGLDRSLQALANLPEELRQRARLIAIGQDKPDAFLRRADMLGVVGQISILPGRDDIPRFLLGADVFLHPAYHEAAGAVLLEALVAGLPVLCTAICGYAHYIVEADGGLVIPEPFAQATMDGLLQRMLQNGEERRRWQANALAFAETADIYSRAERAADFILMEQG
ncbi:MAG: glycosyltransferase family 4 protein [Azonexus sp.]|jgi:UDP-glucose:(heptosyl)LPS alpha-1,3-glucosyltransferase|nr:glycosyltransferase family 4 protein [Azonexus sp.]